MIFNASKHTLTDLHFYFRGEEIEISTAYTYLGVQFTETSFWYAASPPTPTQQRIWVPSPHRETVFPRSVSGHLVQTLPHGGDYRTHSTLWLRDLGTEFDTDRLGSVGESPDLASPAHHQMQTYSPTVHYTGRVRVQPFHLEVIFRLISFLHRVRSFKNSDSRRERYPYLALCSSEVLA
jgi:hypothetical protein